MIKLPMLTKVFLALRTNFIPELKSEHITLKYFNQIRWDALLDISEKYDNQLPATIQLGTKLEWKGFDGGEYRGFNVASHDSNILRQLNMPHITVPKHVWDTLDPIDMVGSVEVIDRLHIVKKIDGQLIWATLKNNQIGIDDDPANWI